MREQLEPDRLGAGGVPARSLPGAVAAEQQPLAGHVQRPPRRDDRRAVRLDDERRTAHQGARDQFRTFEHRGIVILAVEPHGPPRRRDAGLDARRRSNRGDRGGDRRGDDADRLQLDLAFLRTVAVHGDVTLFERVREVDPVPPVDLERRLLSRPAKVRDPPAHLDRIGRHPGCLDVAEGAIGQRVEACGQSGSGVAQRFQDLFLGEALDHGMPETVRAQQSRVSRHEHLPDPE